MLIPVKMSELLDLRCCVGKASQQHRKKSLEAGAAARFLFCPDGAQVKVCQNLTVARKTAREPQHLEDFCTQDRPANKDSEPQCMDDLDKDRLALIMKMSSTTLPLLLPPALAVHLGLFNNIAATAACLPIAVPFSVQHVAPDVWNANKRARAFHNAIVIGVYLQGGIAIMKFASGDLVGGTYLALQVLSGLYAIQPDGLSFIPTYVMVSGLNGVLGLVHVLQNFQGIPFAQLPITALASPIISILSAYFGWQFCREVTAISVGLNGEGPQDTCFVRTFGGDWWPLSWLASAHTSAPSSSSAPGPLQGFSAFTGDGHRLGGSGAFQHED